MIALLQAAHLSLVLVPTSGWDRFGMPIVRARCPAPVSLEAIEMPAILAEWGCDDELWSKVRSKEALVKMADAGDETAARERIATLRNAPSVTGAEVPMPQQLEAWGCDAALWAQVRSKKTLLKLAEDGDEVAARAKMQAVREAVAREAPKTGGWAFEQRKAKREAKNSGRAKPLSEGYTLEGTLPAGVDVAAVEAKLASRVQAKLAKDYDTADKLQVEIEAMGVAVNDRQRTYYPANRKSYGK